MTRTEKYRQYRNEISNMKFDTFSPKKEVAKKVTNVHSEAYGSKIKYEDLMLVQESLGSEEVNFKRKKLIGLTKYEIFYFLIFLLFVIILGVFVILTGIKLWR